MILHIPILLYHRIAQPQANTSLCVSPADFEKHMEHLFNRGYKAISMDEISNYFKRRKKIDKKTIVLTFDDGYEDFYIHAYPILKRFGFNATVFLATDHVGKSNVWDQRDGWPKANLMSWQQIKELARRGVSFGSHGKSHRRLTKLRSVKELISEVKSSKKIIEIGIKKPVRSFSYPYGKQNRFIQLLLRLGGYDFGVTANRGINTLSSNPYCLKRIEINTRNANLQDFIRVVTLTEKDLYPKFNILQVITCSSWGGQEMQAIYLSESLKERGHEVIIACRKKGPVELNAKALGLKTYSLVVKASADLRAITRLMFIILKENIDIVHVHPAKDYWPAIIAAKLLGKRVVVSRHLLTELRQVTLGLLNYADRVIAVSEAVKNTLVDSGRITPARIDIIHNGVDTEQYSPLVSSNGFRRELNIDLEAPLIGCIGRMGCKGQSDLLYAMKKVCKVFPEARCVFISEASDPDELRDDLEKLKLRKNIIFKGFQTDVPRIIATIDILVNVPVWEAFGLILIEAMATGKPVVASNVGGIPEIVRDRYNGILVPPHDPAALAEALIYLIRHRKEAINMGRRGRQLVVEKFDLANTVRNTEELYSEVFYQFSPHQKNSPRNTLNPLLNKEFCA
jgi:glycosyltransferase involved in cell wall biosynthesis